MTQKGTRYINFISVSLTAASIAVMSKVSISNTYLWLAVDIFILVYFIQAHRKYFDNSQESLFAAVKLYLGWNLVCIVRGFFVAENYWEYKNLVTIIPVLLLPLAVFMASNPDILVRLLRSWIKYVLPLFFLAIPFLKGDGQGRFLAPILMMLLFWKYLGRKERLFATILIVIVLISSLQSGARSSTIKYTMSLAMGIFLTTRSSINTAILRVVRIVFLFSPIVFFILAITGLFNIFNLGGRLEQDNIIHSSVTANTNESNDFFVDTRTVIYTEVLGSAINNNYYLFGRTPARGNDSFLFGSVLADDLKTNKNERFMNEVSVLNIFTWNGIVGVILYFIVFFRASYLAVLKSNNSIIKIIGLFVSFRWTYAWIEDFTNFDLSYVFLWIMIGMCFSVSFRQMSEADICNWIQGIFSSKRHRKSALQMMILQDAVNS